MRKHYKFFDNLIFNNFNKILFALKLLKIEQDFEREKILNRSLVLIDEAEKNNIKIRPLVKKNNQHLNYLHFKKKQ